MKKQPASGVADNRRDICALGDVGTHVQLQGRLHMVQLPPREAAAELVAELVMDPVGDGRSSDQTSADNTPSNSVALVWLGRRHIAGITAGRYIKASGRIALRNGRKTIYNPLYELLPAE